MARFELFDRFGVPPPGPWQAGVATTPVVDVALWRADFPATPVAAAAVLNTAEASLRRQQAAIDSAPARIGALAAAETGAGASFTTRALPAPEQALLALVGALRGEPPVASFGGRQSETHPLLDEALSRFAVFVEQVQDTVQNLAVVETRIEGRLVARTSVGWSGNVRTLVRARLPATQAQLHRRTLGLALGSRLALFKAFGTVLRGAGLVAVMLSSPAGAVMALPAAWKFVDQLLNELKQGL